jgi:crossover junction endodeoxyribonuclease RuvC
MMITVLLPTAELTSDDASDALAVAITHAHHRASVLVKMALT